MGRLVHVIVLVGIAGAVVPDVADAAKKQRCRGKKATIVGTKHPAVSPAAVQY